MAFDSFAEFLAMGGYGFYVWLSYGLSLFALFALIVNTRLTTKKQMKAVKERSKREQRVKKAQQMEGTL
ncbi:MAG TPA: heme exporter protein CcmD [Psychromonas hadalis]|nr:heme exporter protein CcmD [Psychromonas hadalis]